MSTAMHYPIFAPGHLCRRRANPPVRRGVGAAQYSGSDNHGAQSPHDRKEASHALGELAGKARCGTRAIVAVPAGRNHTAFAHLSLDWLSVVAPNPVRLRCCCGGSKAFLICKSYRRDAGPACKAVTERRTCASTPERYDSCLPDGAQARSGAVRLFRPAAPQRINRAQQQCSASGGTVEARRARSRPWAFVGALQ
jgi:hypothetical protein